MVKKSLIERISPPTLYQTGGFTIVAGFVVAFYGGISEAMDDLTP